MNGISELFDNAIEKKNIRNLKGDVLKLIGNSRIWDVKRKDGKKDNKEKEKDIDVKRKGRKKDNNNNKKIIIIIIIIIIKKKIVMIAKMLIIMMMIIIMIMIN